MNNVNEDYNKVLQLADSIQVSDDAKITEEQIEEVSEVLDKYAEDSPTAKTQELAEELKANTELPDVQPAVARVTINPATGTPVVTEEATDDNDDEVHLATFEEMMADESIKPFGGDVKDIKVTEEVVTEQLKSYFGNITLSPEDKKKVVDAANDYLSDKKFSAFLALPKLIQGRIKSLVPDAPATSVDMNTYRNMAAEAFLGQIASAAIMNSSVYDYQKMMKEQNKKYYDDMSKDTYWGSIRKSFLVNMEEKAKKFEEDGRPDIAERYRAVRQAFIQSYTYENMLEAYKNKKIKVKKIQIEKFKRTCDEFNRKYATSTNNIHDINLLYKILRRHFEEFHDDIIKEFICIFIKYTMNMRPDKIEEHTFMYYFIYNILSLDMYNAEDEEDVAFHNAHMDAIANFLQTLNTIIDSQFVKIHHRGRTVSDEIE